MRVQALILLSLALCRSAAADAKVPLPPLQAHRIAKTGGIADEGQNSVRRGVADANAAMPTVHKVFQGMPMKEAENGVAAQKLGASQLSQGIASLHSITEDLMRQAEKSKAAEAEAMSLLKKQKSEEAAERINSAAQLASVALKEGQEHTKESSEQVRTGAKEATIGNFEKVDSQAQLMAEKRAENARLFQELEESRKELAGEVLDFDMSKLEDEHDELCEAENQQVKSARTLALSGSGCKSVLTHAAHLSTANIGSPSVISSTSTSSWFALMAFYKGDRSKVPAEYLKTAVDCPLGGKTENCESYWGSDWTGDAANKGFNKASLDKYNLGVGELCVRDKFVEKFIKNFTATKEDNTLTAWRQLTSEFALKPLGFGNTEKWGSLKIRPPAKKMHSCYDWRPAVTVAEQSTTDNFMSKPTVGNLHPFAFATHPQQKLEGKAAWKEGFINSVAATVYQPNSATRQILHAATAGRDINPTIREKMMGLFAKSAVEEGQQTRIKNKLMDCSGDITCEIKDADYLDATGLIVNLQAREMQTGSLTDQTKKRKLRESVVYVQLDADGLGHLDKMIDRSGESTAHLFTEIPGFKVDTFMTMVQETGRGFLSVFVNGLPRHGLTGGYPVMLDVTSLRKTHDSDVFLSKLPRDYRKMAEAQNFPEYPADAAKVESPIAWNRDLSMNRHAAVALSAYSSWHSLKYRGPDAWANMCWSRFMNQGHSARLAGHCHCMQALKSSSPQTTGFPDEHGVMKTFGIQPATVANVAKFLKMEGGYSWPAINHDLCDLEDDKVVSWKKVVEANQVA